MEYRTTDFYLAAYLKTAGYPYKGLDVDTKSRKATFIFEGVAQKDVLEYYNGTGKVSGLAMVNSIRHTKELLYNLPA